MPDFDWPKRETNRLKCASCGKKDRKSFFIKTKTFLRTDRQKIIAERLRYLKLQSVHIQGSF